MSFFAIIALIALVLAALIIYPAARARIDSVLSEGAVLTGAAIAPGVSAEQREGAVRQLVDYINSPRFHWRRTSLMTAYSGDGVFSLVDDLYGPAVKVAGGRELLDCEPEYYNLSQRQALDIYNALTARFYSIKVQDER